MKDMTNLELRLRSWQPRRPSARLERRLFARRVAGRMTPGGWAWLTPAAACILTVMLWLHPRVENGLSGDASPIVALSLSNVGYAAYLPGSFQPEQNRWDTFGWTNTGQFRSSNGPF